MFGMAPAVGEALLSIGIILLGTGACGVWVVWKAILDDIDLFAADPSAVLFRFLVAMLIGVAGILVLAGLHIGALRIKLRRLQQDEPTPGG